MELSLGRYFCTRCNFAATLHPLGCLLIDKEKYEIKE